MPTPSQVERIRALNDQLRRRNISGTILVTAGVAALDPPAQRDMLIALQRFEAFDEANDPHGEHDFGAFAVAGQRLFFKIDYYDRSGTYASPDPADPSVTRRVLTVMLAEEY